MDQQSAELKAKDTPAPDPTKLLCDERCRTQVTIHTPLLLYPRLCHAVWCQVTA